ncbi:MAG TPA: serine protease [Planctomycetes bacterium]|nr:serine protease [Planctomycetota bacterium]
MTAGRTAPPAAMHRPTILLATSTVLLAFGWVHLTDSKEAASSEAVLRRLGQLTGQLETLSKSVDNLSSKVRDLDAQRPTVETDQLLGRMDELDAEALDRYSGLAQTVDANASLVEEAGRGLSELHSQLLPASSHLWRGLLAPTVQLSSPMTVGSGVLLPATEHEPVRVLTAWHVVRDILADSGTGLSEVPVRIYRQDGATLNASAKLLAHDNALDSCLLELVGEHTDLEGTALPTRAHLARMQVFDPVYAVGCPLGSDPVPSHGALSALGHWVDGQSYWMINAPTFIGNSGGGVFDARSMHLLGIVSKLYTHGARRTVVPHMGLVTPLGDIYDWLDRSGYGELIPQ